jgi:cytochrome c5
LFTGPFNCTNSACKRSGVNLSSNGSRALSAALGIITALGWVAVGQANEPVAVLPAAVSIVWSATGAERPVRAWSADEILKLRHGTVHERESQTGRTLAWQGPLLADFIKTSMKDLPLAEQAAVDLVIFRSRTGAIVTMPRWLITKYPVMLATVPASPGALHNKGFAIVLPWSAKPTIRKETLPLSTYALQDVARIELTSYDQVYSAFYLKRRSDPVAMKGEKIFVQNCTSCHATSDRTAAAGIPKAFTIADLVANLRTSKMAFDAHPQIQDAPHLSEREVRALMNYLQAFRGENSDPAHGVVPPAASAKNN